MKESESVCESSHTSVLDMFYTTDKIMETPKKQTATNEDDKDLFDTENRIDLAGAATPTPRNSPTPQEPITKHSPSGTPITVRKLHHDSLTIDAPNTITRNADGTPVSIRKLHHDTLTMRALSSITRGAKASKNHQRNQSSTGDPFVIKGSPAAMHESNMSPSNIGAIRPLRLSRSNTVTATSQRSSQRMGINKPSAKIRRSTSPAVSYHSTPTHCKWISNGQSRHCRPPTAVFKT